MDIISQFNFVRTQYIGYVVDSNHRIMGNYLGIKERIRSVNFFLFKLNNDSTIPIIYLMQLKITKTFFL